MARPKSELVDFDHGSRAVWIQSGEKYLLLKSFQDITTTDTENRNDPSLPRMSDYLTLSTFSEPDEYTQVAKMRLSKDGRCELMKIDAGPLFSGTEIVQLIDQTIVPAFKVGGWTLQDASHCLRGGVEYSIRKIRTLAGKPEGSIYEGLGFKLASCYQKPVGEYPNLTQLPQMLKLAQGLMASVPVQTMLETLVPVVVVPAFQNPRLAKSIESAAKRWGPTTQSVQQLAAQLLSASIHFKQTEATYPLNGVEITKQTFYKDFNLLLNVLLSGQVFEDSQEAIHRNIANLQLPEGATRKAFILLLALSTINSHVIYERQISPSYVPLSTPIELPRFSNFIDGVKWLLDPDLNLPLTWADLCSAPNLKDIVLRS